METETLKCRVAIAEKMEKVKMCLRSARRTMKEATDLASGSNDETLNQSILRDYEHTVAQLLEHIDFWKLPIG